MTCNKRFHQNKYVFQKLNENTKSKAKVKIVKILILFGLLEASF